MTKSTKRVGIIGTGSFVPEKILTNNDLEKIVDTSDEWIIKRTGISERRILDDETPTYTMGIEAAKRALEDANLNAEDIDLIIVSTETPDFMSPSMACIIQGAIGAVNATAFDINAACTGFIYSLAVAQQFIANGVYKHALLIGCEGLSRIVDWKDRNTCILFGDASGAVVLGEVEEGYGILDTFLGSNGAEGMNITIPNLYLSQEEKEKRVNGKYNSIWMDGKEVFKFAVKAMSAATMHVLDKLNMDINELDFIFPHQANTRIIDGAIKKLGITDDKIHYIINKYGNISSASIPVAMDEAKQEGKLKRGDKIVLVAFGGGLTWGSIAVKWFK
ncbi:beta-ketoacyl-ACP synthase III [Ruminiclostridium cellulolyticum]|uniref:Beta-ketoacyl-[acyl-carrier-protein] synthase III n=1 Tax=Ruminiclostridium cellulolyticum (strain ATCC 35319 / DSM 5812 / JCM 6584 / H10) TaxID=394503 RepID=B8I7Q5_RUMCH|nr:beta-ketoacyl-ACP synthase III [Ruminiclostridium cellulolyticum]ACL75062.1 3-oxoacyl-(acyl-carrier-protein) synthase III [Ruminiclostridium cellulolyticum H10]